MEENTQTPISTVSTENTKNTGNIGQKQIAGAIILAGIIVAGAILLKGNMPATSGGTNAGTNAAATDNIAKVSANDRTIGNPNAKVALVMYEDFQCPFCGRFVKDSETTIRNNYVADGRVQFVYRDFSFLGAESGRAAEAARCAGDQGKFWDYHDYLFSHQNGENQGAFADPNLKSFASTLGLDTVSFNQCLDSKKYAKAVTNSTSEGAGAGVTGTPKGYILKDGKVVATIDGAELVAAVTAKLDSALK